MKLLQNPSPKFNIQKSFFSLKIILMDFYFSKNSEGFLFFKNLCRIFLFPKKTSWIFLPTMGTPESELCAEWAVSLPLISTSWPSCSKPNLNTWLVNSCSKPNLNTWLVNSRSKPNPNHVARRFTLQTKPKHVTRQFTLQTKHKHVARRFTLQTKHKHMVCQIHAPNKT